MSDFSWKIPRGNGIWEQIIPNNILWTGTNINDHLNNDQLEKIFLNPDKYIMGIDPYDDGKTIIKQTNMSEMNNITENLNKIEMPVEPKKISWKAIAEDVRNGLTRLTSDPSFNIELGSIESKYELTPTQVKELFKHSSLKGLRVKAVKSPGFEIIEDLEEKEVKTEKAESAFGKPSAATLKEIASNTTTEVKTEEVQLPF